MSVRKRDSGPDRALRAHLRAAVPEPPEHAVDWDALHARILARARPLISLARRRSWWDYLGDWTRLGLPGATAAAAAMLVLAVGVGRRSPAAIEDFATNHVSVEEDLLAVLPEDVRPLVTPEAGTDALLDAALGYSGGEQ